jgi:hypothetical protein
MKKRRVGQTQESVMWWEGQLKSRDGTLREAGLNERVPFNEWEGNQSSNFYKKVCLKLDSEEVGETIRI